MFCSSGSLVLACLVHRTKSLQESFTQTVPPAHVDDSTDTDDLDGAPAIVTADATVQAEPELISVRIGTDLTVHPDAGIALTPVRAGGPDDVAEESAVAARRREQAEREREREEHRVEVQGLQFNLQTKYDTIALLQVRPLSCAESGIASACPPVPTPQCLCPPQIQIFVQNYDVLDSSVCALCCSEIAI